MLATLLWYKGMINPNTLAVISPKDSPEVSATRPQINAFAWSTMFFEIERIYCDSFFLRQSIFVGSKKIFIVLEF